MLYLLYKNIFPPNRQKTILKIDNVGKNNIRLYKDARNIISYYKKIRFDDLWSRWLQDILNIMFITDSSNWLQRLPSSAHITIISLPHPLLSEDHLAIRLPVYLTETSSLANNYVLLDMFSYCLTLNVYVYTLVNMKCDTAVSTSDNGEICRILTTITVTVLENVLEWEYCLEIVWFQLFVFAENRCDFREMVIITRMIHTTRTIQFVNRIVIALQLYLIRVTRSNYYILYTYVVSNFCTIFW